MFRQMVETSDATNSMSYLENLESKFLSGELTKRSYIREVNRKLKAFVESEGVISFA